MNKAKVICEEFCDSFLSSSVIREDNGEALGDIEEFKCTMDIEQFDIFAERMVSAGYCCTQVQNDKGKNKCVAWFEPIEIDCLLE